MQPVLKIEKVSKSYNMGKAGKLQVLNDIDFEISRGEFVVIVGPSGSGKSTIMNIIGTLDSATEGEVYLLNKPVSKMKESTLAGLRGKTIGFIFQKFNLIPTLNTIENVLLPSDFINKTNNEKEKRMTHILNDLGLGERLFHKPGELSGGQQQRVAIARSLSNDPEIILADEPTGNLDSKSGKYVMSFLQKMNGQGKTIILITHDLNLIDYATKIIHLKDGCIEKIQTRKKVKKEGKQNE